jgi:guanylate kinase
MGLEKPDEIASTVSALHSRRGLVIVVSAPSGTGKTTVCAKLLEQMPALSRSVSFTTRPLRKDEQQGRDYYFVTKEEFADERGKGRFVEWAKVHGYLYGTPRDVLEKRVKTGRDTILVIDVQGARSVKEAFADAVLIFLLPPSLAELERRLRLRSSGSREDVNLRLRSAAAEFSCFRTYDYLVVNDNIDEAAATLKAIIIAERHRADRLNR